MATCWYSTDSSGNESETHLYTPLTDVTNSPEVLQLARYWISTCAGPEHPTCPDGTFDNRLRYYPTRLLELPPYHQKLHAIEEQKLRLVITQGHTIQPVQIPRTETSRNMRLDDVDLQHGEARLQAPPRGHYATLSHCWGQVRLLTLRKDNLTKFQEGIDLNNLPETFRQAIDFARRLRKDIRYIWIDALCIVQDDKEDWEKESVKMYDVYRNSFCNLSATAATDGSNGIHTRRDPRRLWEDEINLNTDGMPRPLEEVQNTRLLGIEPLIRRCTVQDASFWSRLVDDAPVNRRAWVLQERLLAPRVLHFCGNQIAWECRHLDAAESFPHGSSSLAIESGDVVDRERLKQSLPQEYGPRPLIPDSAELSLAAHEYWKRIVERYSTTSITKDTDRLIALAGIAELISKQIGRNVLYVAGLWEKWLASQLLWRVKPEYQDDTPLYPQRRPRPEDYCAPSFSWAAVKAPQGIKCGETVREDDLYISVDNIHLSPVSDEGRFGQVGPDCYIEITGILHGIEVLRKRKKGRVRYRWRLLTGSSSQTKELSNLYLDSPADDETHIVGREAQVLCVPAHKNHENSITCLILQRVHGGTAPDHFRRVGLAYIPPYEAAWIAVMGPGNGDQTEQALSKRTNERMEGLKSEIKRLQSENEALRSQLANGGPNAQPASTALGLPNGTSHNMVDHHVIGTRMRIL